MPKDITGAPWEDTHTETLTRGIVSLVLAHRSDLYALDGLKGVNNNGGDRINKKVQQILRQLTAGLAGGDNMVKEEVAKGGRAKKSPKKDSTGSSSIGTPSPSKKRKTAVKQEMESDEE